MKCFSYPNLCGYKCFSHLLRQEKEKGGERRTNLHTFSNYILIRTFFPKGSDDEEVSGSEEEANEGEEKKSKSSRKRKMSSAVAQGGSGEHISDGGSSDEQSGHVKSKVARVSKKKRRNKIEKYFEGARYFVMKSNNNENVLLSKAKVC